MPPDPSPVQLGYLAGLMDADGSFIVSQRTNAFGLQVGMCDIGPVSWCHENFGGRIEKGIIRTDGGTRIHRWTLQRQEDLRYLLPKLMPYLQAKSLQAWAMLRLVEIRRSQPHWTLITSRAPNFERPIRAAQREQWLHDEALARQGVRSARYAARPAI